MIQTLSSVLLLCQQKGYRSRPCISSPNSPTKTYWWRLGLRRSSCTACEHHVFSPSRLLCENDGCAEIPGGNDKAIPMCCIRLSLVVGWCVLAKLQEQIWHFWKSWSPKIPWFSNSAPTAVRTCQPLNTPWQCMPFSRPSGPKIRDGFCVLSLVW